MCVTKPSIHGEKVPINDIFHSSQGTFLFLLGKYLISLQVSELALMTQHEKLNSHWKYKNTWKITVTLMTPRQKKKN